MKETRVHTTYLSNIASKHALYKKVLLLRNTVHSGSLILVNGDYPFCEKFCEKRLAPISEKNNKVLLEVKTASILKALLDDVDDRKQIVGVSGFRSKYEQKQIYETSLLDYGAEFTTKYVARPNYSEHQSGLAIDLALNQPDIDTLRPYFPYTGICRAFRDKAVLFGFIERYPKGKESITGIAHEPWHFRYVGMPHSKIMHEMGVTLEEYLLWLQEFPYGGEPFRYSYDGSDIEIFYLAAGSEYALFETADELPYQISGNNMEGFIITIWREHR